MTPVYIDKDGQRVLVGKIIPKDSKTLFDHESGDSVTLFHARPAWDLVGQDFLTHSAAVFWLTCYGLVEA